MTMAELGIRIDALDGGARGFCSLSGSFRSSRITIVIFVVPVIEVQPTAVCIALPFCCGVVDTTQVPPIPV